MRRDRRQDSLQRHVRPRPAQPPQIAAATSSINIYITNPGCRTRQQTGPYGRCQGFWARTDSIALTLGTSLAASVADPIMTSARPHFTYTSQAKRVSAPAAVAAGPSPDVATIIMILLGFALWAVAVACRPVIA